jgi:hypothetical protein
MANTYVATFDGTGDYATKSSPTGLPSGSAARTVEAWVRTANASSQTVFSFGDDSALGGWEFKVESGKIGIAIEGANQYWTATGVTNDSWHHIAVTYVAGSNMNDTTNIKAYMDGSALTSTSSVMGVPNTTTTRLRIASDPAAAASALFDGEIDEVRIWDDVRTPTELTDYDRRELAGNESGLVAYFKFNNSWVDSTSNANDLTASGDATFNTNIPFQGVFDLVADTGTFVLTGFSAGKLYRLTCEVGSYILTGVSALFSKTGWNSIIKPTTTWTAINKP